MACIFPLTRNSYGSPLLPVPLWRAEEQIKYLRATGTPRTPPAAEPPQTPVMLYGHFDNQSRYTTPAGKSCASGWPAWPPRAGSPWDCSFVGVPPDALVGPAPRRRRRGLLRLPGRA